MEVKWLVEKITEMDGKLSEVEDLLKQKCMELPHAKNILSIPGIAENTLSLILAEIGDISRFDDVKEIQKMSGLGLVTCSSGKHKGETRISHRGRKKLRNDEKKISGYRDAPDQTEYQTYNAGKQERRSSGVFDALSVIVG